MSEKPAQGWELDGRVLALLACPACQGELRVAAEGLVCAACGRAYPIVDGIPQLLATSS